MEAALKLTDGMKGSVKSTPGQKLKLTIECEDTDTNRAFLLDRLFEMQTARFGYDLKANEDMRDPFPPLTIELGTGADGYKTFILKEDRYGGFPIFSTFTCTRWDLRNAYRALICLNRHTGIHDRHLESLPHAGDVADAYRILAHAIEGLLEARPEPVREEAATTMLGLREEREARDREKANDPVGYYIEEIRATWAEAKQYYQPATPEQLKYDLTIPKDFRRLPTMKTKCDECGGSRASHFRECHHPGDAAPGHCRFLEDEGEEDGPQPARV